MYKKITFTSVAIIVMCILWPIVTHASILGDESYISTTNTDQYADIPYVDGETSLGVQVIEELSGYHISFEVPLYVTMAVLDLEEDVVAPNNYNIYNFSMDNTGQRFLDVAVVAITAIKHDTFDYWTFTDEEIIDDNQMNLSVGGVPIVLGNYDNSILDLSNSIFYNNNAETFQLIYYGEGLNIPIVGSVKPALRAGADETAVAQFRLCYTVSAVIDGETPLGMLYEGPYPAGYAPVL